MLVHQSVICHKSVLISKRFVCSFVGKKCLLLFRFREHMAGVHGEKDFHFEHGHVHAGPEAAGAPHR
jgi:hypothetical protein